MRRKAVEELTRPCHPSIPIVPGARGVYRFKICETCANPIVVDGPGFGFVLGDPIGFK